MTLKQIRAAVENEFKLNISLKGRQQKSVNARAIYCLLSRELTLATYEEIAKEVKRKHATVLYLEKKARYFIDVEPKYKDSYINIKNNLSFPVAQEQQDVKIVERIVYKDSIQDLRECERSILKALINVNDSDILDFTNTRLKPYLEMLKTKRVHIVREVAGAHRSFSIK